MFLTPKQAKKLVKHLKVVKDVNEAPDDHEEAIWVASSLSLIDDNNKCTSYSDVSMQTIENVR